MGRLSMQWQLFIFCPCLVPIFACVSGLSILDSPFEFSKVHFDNKQHGSFVDYLEKRFYESNN
jgi:hypothetical protein